MAKRKTMQDLGYVEDMSGMFQAPSPDDDDAGSGSGVRQYYGKYRGTVLQNVDPMRSGRLQIQVPDVYGPNFSTWALPCLPSGGMLTGMYVAPPIGAGVWVEFEQGDPDYPIWVGCWWGSLAETPNQAKITTPGVPVITLESLGQKAIVISDTPVPPLLPQGGILLSAGPQTFIAVGPAGINIQSPLTSLNLTLPPGAGVVNVNNGALLVK